ncbi:hypothetical protein P7K49_027786 [Saguinus oedipus]|uniref:Uncharacterized protein n=1 Tax=Saguinus oedipus TaxID=9490 RepID=A0ABQ9UAE8_SAGOE|nr:hypothetical protein P7K49_027786 [Saguinus oedipus]
MDWLPWVSYMLSPKPWAGIITEVCRQLAGSGHCPIWSSSLGLPRKVGLQTLPSHPSVTKCEMWECCPATLSFLSLQQGKRSSVKAGGGLEGTSREEPHKHKVYPTPLAVTA